MNTPLHVKLCPARSLSLSLLMTGLVSCVRPTALPPSGSVSLSAIPLEDVKTSGQLLMSLTDGLHPVLPEQGERTTDADAPVFLLIHGFKSGGYEWIYTAHTASRLGSVYVYRWDWERCPSEAAQALSAQLTALAQQRPKAPIIAIGHSYGGLILSRALAKYGASVPLEAHVVAAPLAGHPSLSARCGEDAIGGARPSQGHVKLIQWRTRRDLDGAFQGLNFDPQQSEAPHLSVELASQYRGARLGHNWSISAVIDRLKACPKPFADGRLMCFKQRGASEGDPSDSAGPSSAKE